MRYMTARATTAFLSVLLLALHFGILAGPQAPQAAPAAEITEYLEEVALRQGVPGISAAVAVNGVMVYSGGAGYADLNHQVAATGSTVHNIGSVSKVNAVIGVMALIQEGKVDLDDPIQKYVPTFPEKGAPIAVKHILTHTSGIRHYRDDFENGMENMRRYMSIGDAIGIFKDDPLLFDPGAHWSYSSYASNLLAGIVETASGRGFEQYLTERVWRPAGMTRTSFDVAERIVRNRARAYLKVPEALADRFGFEAGELIHVPYGDVSYKWAGGGIISTAEDQVRLASALNAGKLLNAETMELMYTPPFESLTAFRGGQEPRPINFKQALFWRLNTDSHAHRVIHHGGSVKGFKTFLGNYPDQGVVVCVVGNIGSFNPQPVATAIAEMFLK